MIRSIAITLLNTRIVRRSMPVDFGKANGYDVFVVAEGGSVDGADPSKQTLVVDSTTVPVSVGPDGTLYTVYVRARTASGKVSTPAVAVLKLIADGGDLVARPNSPAISKMAAIDNGDVLVQWEHDEAHASAETTAFNVYVVDSPEELQSLPTASATVNSLSRSAVISGLTVDMPHLVLVRAASEDGTEDGNCSARLVTPRNDPPTGQASDAVIVVQE